MKALFKHIFNRLRADDWQSLLIRLAAIGVIVALLVLPYFLFGTRMHAEGDDSHLYFHYPELWIKNIANSSWMSFSSAGKQDEHFFLLPILYLFWGIKQLGIPTFVIQNLSFSAIFILGFVFFQKLVRELLPNNKDYRVELLFGALMYIFSPIILIAPLRSYLAPIWLIGALPLMVYLLVRYIKTNRPIYLAISGLCAVVLSVALNALPWLLGCVLPVAVGGAALSVLTSGVEKRTFFKRTGYWLLVVGLCQAFWLTSFAVSLSGSNSLGGRIFNDDVKQSFSRTVITTDRGNTVIDPLLNLFHREIQRDFNWTSYTTYVNWYNHLIPLTSVYIVILLLGVLFAGRFGSRVYWFLFSSFLVALFLFTVHIGWLENLFLLAGGVPGFAMFRNFYNKFALGYVLLYASIITFSLIYIKQGLKQRYFVIPLYVAGFLAIALNARPFFTGEIINANLQDTPHVQRNLHMPQEYLDFMQQLGKMVPSNSNVFDVPFGTSAYTIIPETGSDHAYSGKSPVKLFSGISDFSGNLSFPPAIARQVNAAIMQRDYVKLRHLLSSLHINYIFETKNIPAELIQSSLFDDRVLIKTDAEFRQQLYGQKLLTSADGNYVLYSLKQTQEALPADSFVAATTAYAVSPPLLDANGNMLSGSLGYFLDVAHIGLKEGAQGSQLADAKVKPFTLGDAIADAAKSTIEVPHNNLYQVVSSDLTGVLGLQNLAKATYTHDQIPPQTVSVGQLSPDNLIQINNEFYPPSKLNGAVISDTDNITVLQKSGELTGGTTNVYQHWVPGDCTAEDKGKLVAVAHDVAADVITLTAKKDHNACLFSDMPTKVSASYVVSFEYNTNMTGASLGITQRDKLTDANRTIGSPFQAGPSNQWNSFSYTFSAQDGTARIYLFSGRSPQQAVTSFRNIQISEYDPTRTVSLANSGFSDPEVGEYSAAAMNSAPVSATNVPVPPLSEWRQGDCNALDDSLTTDFTHLDDGIQLSAKDGHNACIRLVTDIDTNYSYTMGFDYYATGSSGAFKMAYINDPGFPLTKYSEPEVQNSWHHVTINPSSPDGAKRLTLYLYSGTNSKGTAQIKYRNLTIKRAPKTFSENLIVTQAAAAHTPPTVSSTEIAPHLYNVKVAAAKSGFFLNFLEPYHAGWQLSVVSGKRANSVMPHVTANVQTNAWYIDVNTLCKEQKRCAQNPDGSYNIELTATFTPEKYFYVGLGLSALAVLSCIGYLVWCWRRKHWLLRLF